MKKIMVSCIIIILRQLQPIRRQTLCILEYSIISNNWKKSHTSFFYLKQTAIIKTARGITFAMAIPTVAETWLNPAKLKLIANLTHYPNINIYEYGSGSHENSP